MDLKTVNKVEFRFVKTVSGKNGAYYLYTFETEDSSFTFYCKEFFQLSKGELYNLEFNVSVFNNNNNFTLSKVF